MENKLSPFERKSFMESRSFIGSGELGGKAKGLVFIEEFLSQEFNKEDFPDFEVHVPSMSVIRTDIFDSFMRENNLNEIDFSELSDERIGHLFQKASLPVQILGDLRALVKEVKTPLAIRSSSLLEDAKFEPFAGIYGTKMLPNNEPDPDKRFKKLVEAIKFVYGSTFFKAARDYISATEHDIKNEKMAVIIQEVVGTKHGDRFYPVISGVGRSYNFYPTGNASQEDGIVNLALGLGKTIVDGGKVWSYSPSFPRATPPYGSVRDLLKMTQTDFWAIRMGKPPVYDPLKETEFMVNLNLEDAEKDNILTHIASTYYGPSDRLYTGTGRQGPRVLTFAPMLTMEKLPLNKLLKTLLSISEKAYKNPVEIEFAVSIDKDLKGKFGFLQVRPMVVSSEEVTIEDREMEGDNVLLSTETLMGNGTNNDISEIIYVKPENFNPKNTRKIGEEIRKINSRLVKEKNPYLLIGFGRWGSSDPWLGIPVNWSDICGAKVIVEATLPEMNVDLSQGSHFFHNITSFQVCYFSVRHSKKSKINWNWLSENEIVEETEFIRHVKLKSPLMVKADGRSGKGVILIDK